MNWDNGKARLRGEISIVAAIVAVFVLHVGSATAQTRLTGPPDAVRLEVREAPLEEILGALANKYRLQYRSKIPLDRRVSGTYSGRLARVVSRLLEGYDYVVKQLPDGLEVVVLRSAKAVVPSDDIPGIPAQSNPRSRREL